MKNFFLFLLLTVSAVHAQETHIVKNFNDYYQPQVTTINQGDTILWDNVRGGALTHQHDLISVGNLFPGRGFGHQWQYSYTFNEPGTYDFHCSRHGAPDGGEMGTIIVLPGSGNGGTTTTYDLQPCLNGNWWSGTSRNGEGMQLEISDGGNGDLTVVATLYGYAPDSGQIFLIMVGTASDESAEMEVFITAGGSWGVNLNPASVSETAWGTATLTGVASDALQLVLSPNAAHQSLGYSPITLDLERLTNPIEACGN